MRLAMVSLLLTFAACGDDSQAPMTDAPSHDASRDAAVDAPAIDAPSADAEGDALADGSAPLTGIAGVRMAADTTPGAVSIDVANVRVTMLKPAVGSEPAGFFVQQQQAGPAVFIAVDPATLSPAAAVGDDVSFTVTMVAKVTGLREATALTGYTRNSSGNDVTALRTDVSSATDLVSNLDAYESRLIRLTGTLSSAFSGAGGGFSSAQIDTAGVTGNANLKLRLPTTLQTQMDLANACALTVTAGAMWRFNTQAQPSAFVAGNLNVASCPAPRVVGAAASNATTVVVTFDRTLATASVMSDGSQFTLGGGLIASAATVSGRTATVTTSTQTASASYSVTVAQSVTDTFGTGIDATAASANFSGYVQLATLVINEINPNIGGNLDLIELRATAAGTVNNMTVGQALGVPVTVATLPNLSVAAGDLIVIHLTPGAVTTETTSMGSCTDAACYAGAWDVAGSTTGLTYSHRVVWVKNPDGSLHDAVPFVNTAVSTPPSAFPGDLQTLQSMGLWLPGDCGGALCTYTSTPTAVAISADWTGTGATATGNSAQRTANNHMASDWHVAAPTFGAANQ